MNFDKSGKAEVVCQECGKVHEVTTKTALGRTRLEHIFDFVIASLRSQGYKNGYLCRKCEKKHGIDTGETRAICKKLFTPQFFAGRQGITVD